ncbi:MAG: hypothetical protein ACPF9D_11150, partial [Owenweeksia sp.]
YADFAGFYLNFRGTNFHPVVGVSYNQILDYSKWRSDRVMQQYLITSKIIAYHPDTLPNAAFTIERYFSGQYYDYKPDPRVMYYLEYALPDSLTYYNIVSFADSLNEANYKYCKGKKYCTENFLLGCCEEYDKELPSFYRCEPLGGVVCDCRKDLITHLYNNVRELTADSTLVFGSGYPDTCETGYVFRKVEPTPNAYTGFRNICIYKRWEGKSTAAN